MVRLMYLLWYWFDNLWDVIRGLKATTPQARRCVRCTFQGSFSVFSILKWEIDTYQNGLGYMSDTYPNPYPPCDGTPLMIILVKVTHKFFFTFESLLSNFWDAFTGTPKVTFESLFRLFEFFGVWGSVGLLPDHNPKGPKIEKKFGLAWTGTPQKKKTQKLPPGPRPPIPWETKNQRNTKNTW